MSNAAPQNVGRSWSPFPGLAHTIDWLTGHARLVLVLAVAFQVLVLVAMMVRPIVTLATGEVFLLRVAPVDPRDLFRGDYVILSYDVSRPTRDGSSDPTNVTWQQLSALAGKTIYTRLAPDTDGSHWHANGYQLEPPSEGKFIRGEVGVNGLVRYGIEQYFVQEGQGHDYEQAVRDRKLSAEVAVDGNGNAQLKGLVIE
jgi:uncharacterized membrane-anchored protein